VANLVIRPHVYEKHRAAASGAVAVIVDGRVERVGEVIHVNVQILRDATKGIAELRSLSRDFQ
jgi:error-prone DNA polymerase